MPKQRTEYPSHIFPVYPRIVGCYEVTCNAPPLSNGHEQSAVAGVLTFPLDERDQDSHGPCTGLS
jgi:hypothetical protein